MSSHTNWIVLCTLAHGAGTQPAFCSSTWNSDVLELEGSPCLSQKRLHFHTRFLYILACVEDPLACGAAPRRKRFHSHVIHRVGKHFYEYFNCWSHCNPCTTLATCCTAVSTCLPMVSWFVWHYQPGTTICLNSEMKYQLLNLTPDPGKIMCSAFNKNIAWIWLP